MTSRFISAGIIAGDADTPSAPSPAPPSAPSAPAPSPPAPAPEARETRNAAQWEAVQKDLEAGRKAREERRRAAGEGGGGERSLFEVLRDNKAAKQAAFEEANRLRNQFRALDEDEIEFLSGVRDEEKAEEERVRRETEEGLEGFRRARLAVAEGGAEGTDVGGDGEEAWGAGKKRKRERERGKVFRGVKRRGSLPGEEEKEAGDEKDGKDGKDEVKGASPAGEEAETGTPAKTEKTEKTESEPKPKPVLGLVDYGSDDDDD